MVQGPEHGIVHHRDRVERGCAEWLGEVRRKMAAVEVRGRTLPGVNGHVPDPRVLAVTGVLQCRLPDAQAVVLFGSRALGNWRPWSDLDLAAIGGPGDRDSEASLHQQAEAIARWLGFHLFRGQSGPSRPHGPRGGGPV